MSKPEGTIKITEDMIGDGSLTVDLDKIVDNVRVNIQRHLPQMRYWPPNGKECVIAAGGPSLKTHFHELRDLHFNEPPVTLPDRVGNAGWIVSAECIRNDVAD